MTSLTYLPPLAVLLTPRIRSLGNALFGDISRRPFHEDPQGILLLGKDAENEYGQDRLPSFAARSTLSPSMPGQSEIEL